MSYTTFSARDGYKPAPITGSDGSPSSKIPAEPGNAARTQAEPEVTSDQPAIDDINPDEIPF